MTGFVRKHIALKRVIAVFLAATFFLTYVLNDASAIVRESVRSSLSPASEEYAHLDPDTFSIPEHLGMIKHVYNASSRKIVIHIQDAHCNYFAQNKISELIDYLNSEYGISMINLEGGMGDYDLKTFETMSDTKVRKEVTDYFVKMGELSGAEKFAISNPDRVKLWGIENKDLYFKNLKVYQDSLRDKEKIDKYLKELTYILNNLKRHIFTQDLLELDMQYNAYKADNNGLRHYLEYLLSEASKRDIEISRFPNLGKLVESVSIEEKINFSRANTERNILIDRLKEELSLEEIQELVARSIEFKTRKISRKKFYSYLFGKAKEVDLSLKQFPQLKSYMEYISLYETVDRMKVMDEFDDLENTIKEALYENDAQRELNTLSRNLTLLKNIFNVSIRKDDYAYYGDNEEDFLMSNYLDFIENYAPRYKISARPSLGIEELDDYREEIFKFYEYSFQRDEAFVSNMKFSDLPGEVESALIITGGFHTENLCELLKEKGISCISILPRFKINEEYESPYFALLAGKRKPVEQNIGEVVGFWLAFRSMLSGLAGEKEKIVFDLHAKWREALLEGKNGLVLQYGEEVLGAIDSKGEITSEEIDNFEIVNVEEIAPELMLPEAWEVLKAESITIDASDPDFVLPKGSFFRFVNADNLTEAERKKVLLQTEGSDDEDIIRWEELSLKFSRLNDVIKSFSDQASLRIIQGSFSFAPPKDNIAFSWVSFALSELLKNAFVHGNRQDLSLDVSVEWKIEDGSLVLQVSDHAVDKEISDVEASIAKTALVHGYGLGRLEMKKIGITLTESIKEGVGIHTAIFPLEDVDLLLATTDWLKRLTPWAPAWLRSLVIAPIVEEPIYRGLPILISLLIAPLVMSSFPVMGVLAITMTALVGQAISAVIFIRQHDKGKDIVQMAPFLVSMLTFAQFMGNASSPLTFLGLAIVTHFIVNLHSMLFPKIEIKPSERVGVEEEIEEDIQVIDGVVLDTKPVTIKKVEGLDKLRTDLPKEEPVKQRRPGVIGAELREGLSSPVRFFRTIFIFALIFLFVPLGLSQMACMSIDQQTQEDVFPEFESEIFRIESRVIVPTPINEFVQNSGESFYLRNYEKTIGTEFGVNANLPEVETLFGRGGDTKRAFLAIGSKDTSGIMYDSSGMPIGWEDFPLAVSDLVMLVRKAKENNVKLNLVLHDYSLADLDAHPDVITDPEKRQALIDLDRELLEAALLELGADSEWIASVEIMNEANLAIENTFTEDVQSFIQEGIVMVRETSIGTPISISTYTLEGLLYFRDNLQPGDSVQIHAYPDTVSNVPGDTFVEKFMYIGQYLNIPDGVDIYIGEIPAHDDLGAWQMEEVLRAAHQAGFKGVWFWFDNRPNPYYTFSDAEYQNAIGALQALPAVPEAPEIPFELEELFPEEPLTPHAGFGVRMTGKSYDSEMNIFLRKEDLRLDIENDRILKNFNKLSIEINGVTSTIYVHRLVLERIEEQRMTIQSFIDECIKIRGPDFEERLRAGLQGKPLIIDALEKSPALYGNCIQDGYIYINEKALKKDVPFDLSIVGVSHELMHEAGIFDELDMAEGKLAEQDIKAMLDIGLNPLEVFEKIPNINLTKYIFFAYQGLLADAIGQDRVSGMGLGSAEFREELSKAIEARLEEKPVTPRELLESMTRTLIRGDQKVIIKEPVAQEILKSPFAEEILREIPAGCTPLGFGSTAIALKTPDGKALRIGPVKSRPNIPEVLQAGKRKIIGDLWQIEELALVSQEGLTVKDLNDLETKIKKRGYEFVDEGLDNIGRLPAGEIVVIDPGAVARMVTPSTMPVMEGSFKIGGETYRINTTDNRQRMAETLDKWFSRDKERVWNRNNWDYSGKRLTGDEYPTYLTSIESDSGEVLGMLTFHFRKKGEYFGGGRLPDDEYIVIDYIEVAPETREQGLGKILLARAFEEAKYYLADRDGPFDLAEYGSYNVALVHPAEDSEDVEKGKRAIDFFQRMGFSVVYQDSISGLDAEEAELQRFMGITGNRARVLLNEVRDQLGLPTDVELEPGEYDEYAEDIREYYEEVELAPLEEPSVLDQELAGTLTRVTTEFNRNTQLDAFMEKYINEKDIAGEALIVDMGVGYPPVTTVEAARRFFGKARIVGVDINIPAYAVEFLKDAESNYIAFFDSNNEITYIAEVNRAKEGFYHSPLKKDEEAEVRKEALSIRDNFTRKGKGKDYSEAGASITFDPVQKYGSGEENLSFIRGDFIKGDFDLPRDADVIRAANVVLYYSAEEVRMAISKTGAKLKEGGILILGDNDSFVLYEKRKIEGTLVMVPVTLAGHTNVGLLSDAVGKTYLHASRYLTKIGIFSKGKQKAFPQYKRELDALEEAFTTAIRGYEDWAQLRDRADEHYVTIDAFIIQEMHKILVRHGVDSYIDRAGYLNVALSDKGMIPVVSRKELPPVGGGMNWDDVIKFTRERGVDWAIGYLKLTGLYSQADAVREALKDDPERLAEFEVAYSDLIGEKRKTPAPTIKKMKVPVDGLSILKTKGVMEYLSSVVGEEIEAKAMINLIESCINRDGFGDIQSEKFTENLLESRRITLDLRKMVEKESQGRYETVEDINDLIDEVFPEFNKFNVREEILVFSEKEKQVSMYPSKIYDKLSSLIDLLRVQMFPDDVTVIYLSDDGVTQIETTLGDLRKEGIILPSFSEKNTLVLLRLREDAEPEIVKVKVGSIPEEPLPPIGGGMNWNDVVTYTQENGVDWAIGYLKLTGLYDQADAVREALKDDPESLAKFEVAFAELFRGRKITSEEQLRGPVSIGEDTVQVERLFQVMRALDRGAEPATRMEDGIVFYDAYDIKRALSDEPIKVLAQSLAELHRENLLSVVERGDPDMREILVNKYTGAIKEGKAVIAVKDGEIIGFIAHAIGLENLAIIDTFAVRREFRERGIGTNLMDIAVQNIIEEVRPTEIFIATPGELAEWYEEYLKKSNLRYDRDEEDSITVYLGGEEKMRAFQRLENIPELKGLISYKLEDIDEKYPEVESGAQGIIYVDPDDSRISYKLARDSSINEDDIQEARNIVELNSLGVTSGIPKLLAIGLDPDGFFWMKLEGIENAQDLFEYTRQGKWGVLPFTKKVEIFIKIAKIINELHKVGRIHFDIKPENILINDRGKVMVIDFRTVGKEGDKAVMGTPEYQPPEKVMRFKSDIFSLGRVMHDQLNILRDEELDISAENIQRSGLIDLVGWMTLMDASTRAPEDMETVVKSLETALVYLKAVEGREFVAEAVPLKIESIYPASREAEEVMRALNAPYNINFIRHEGRILTPENEAALYLAEKRVRDGFSDKVLSMELNIVPEYALGTSTYHFNDGEKTPMERDTGHILYYTKDKGTYKRPSAREVIAYIALSPEAGYTIYETFVNLVERLKISGADFSAKAASPRSTVLNKDNIVVTIPEYDLSRAIPVLREFVAENSLMIDEKAVPVGARDPDAKGLSWLREDKALSLKEAYLLLGHFIPADSNSMGDLKYSYDLAEEVGKYPIETVLVSGMGQRYLGLLLALMGKKVIFVDMDPMSISIFEGNREVLAEQLEKEGYDIELDIQAIQSEIGALDLEANGIEAGSFDLVTFIDLAGGTTIFGDPEVWLETASLLLKDEGYVVWHEGIIGKEYEWVQKIFQETFPDNEVVAEGKYFHGIHDADRGANIFYKVVNTPRIETRERAERIKKAVESSRKILALSRLNNPSAILIGLTENQMLGELTHGQRFANKSRRVIEKKYNGNLRALYYERGDAESLEAAKDKAISWRDSLSEEAQARFQMLAYVDNNNMDREVANNADFIIAVNELSKMNQVAGVIREEIVEGQKLDEVLHIILALGLMDYERTQRIEMKNRILDLLSVMVDNPGELENVDINELLKGITFVRIKSLFAEMAERFEAQEEVLRSL